MTVLHAELDKAIAKVEASMQAIVDQLHRRIDTTRELAITDVSKLKEDVAADIAAFHQRVQELEDGIIRHRDQLMQALRAEALDKLHELEKRIEAVEKKG